MLFSRLKSELEKRIKKLEVGHILEITTYKRDRGFSIYALEADKFKLKEFGYNRALYESVTAKEVLNLSEKIIQVEFPRSHQVRVYTYENGEGFFSENR